MQPISPTDLHNGSHRIFLQNRAIQSVKSLPRKDLNTAQSVLWILSSERNMSMIWNTLTNAARLVGQRWL
jgi:hypothetical protein